MPKPVTYAEAAALAQRLDRARERGATLLLDGEEIRGFECLESAQEPNQINTLTVGNWATAFYRPHWSMPFAEFESYWQSRITVTYPGPWPTGEPVVAGLAGKELDLLEGYLLGSEHPDWAKAAESATRLAQMCRELATETSER